MAVLLALMWSARAAAQTKATAGPEAVTLEGALQASFANSDEGLKVLRDAGATYDDVLTLERLPSAEYVAEIGVQLGQNELRYPVKLRHDKGIWSVTWEPVPAYASALVSMARSGRLPHARSELRWADVARMPAFGIIGTAKRIVTPFGAVDPAERAKGASQGDLYISPTLVQYVQQWVKTVLDDDPAPAGFDLILDEQTSWKFANRLMFNASAVGLYQIGIVTSSSGKLGVVRVSAPVSSVTSADHPAPTVMAMFPLEGGGFGLRISVAGNLLPSSKGCVQGMTLCVKDASMLPAALDGVVEPGGAQAMFAAPEDVSVGDGVAFMAAFIDFMGLGSHRLLMGYVQK